MAFLMLVFTILGMLFLDVNSHEVLNSCKIKEKAAYDACLKKAAKDKSDRLMCSLMYLEKFPSCYFGKLKLCAEDLFKSFANCVVESQSHAEIRACVNVREGRRKVCQPKSSKREAAIDGDRIRMCSACKEERDRDCGVNTTSEGDWLQCLDAWKKLPRCQKCLE